MAHYCVIERKSAPLYSDFARPFLERHFSPEVVAALYDAVGVYSRGARKGKARGYVHWDKCVKGGWYRPDGGYGRVLPPGSHNITVKIDFDRVILDGNANATDEGRIAAMRETIANRGQRRWY